MIDEQQAGFEAWVSKQSVVKKYGAKLHRSSCGNHYKDLRINQRWLAFKAGQAALASPEVQKQPQYETQLQVWRSTDSCQEFWSWDEADQYDYDQALPENRRIIQIIKEG